MVRKWTVQFTLGGWRTSTEWPAVWTKRVAAELAVLKKQKQNNTLLTTSNSNLSSVEDTCKPECLSPTARHWNNSFCSLQRTFRAFQWHRMFSGGALVTFSSSFRKMAFVSASTFYGKRKSKSIILFIEHILSWNVVGIFYTRCLNNTFKHFLNYYNCILALYLSV